MGQPASLTQPTTIQPPADSKPVGDEGSNLKAQAASATGSRAPWLQKTWASKIEVSASMLLLHSIWRRASLFCPCVHWWYLNA